MATASNSRVLRTIPLLLIAFLFCPLTYGKVIYVDDDAVGADDGTSWENAYVYLQDALIDANAARRPAEINVAQGLYRPDQGANQVPGDRGATFLLINGVTLRGGYAGLGQADPNVRDVCDFAAVLHGDLKGDDGPEFAHYANNSQTVVTSVDNDDTAVLDGFTITGGLGWSGPGISCYYSNALFMNCTISRNKSIGREGGWGGGMYISGGRPTLVNCTFSFNWALAEGGGIWCQSRSKPTLTGCLFRGNVAVVGGGLSAAQSDPVLTNCVFENNEASYGAGLGSHYEGHPLLNNCTFFGNRGSNGAAMYMGYESPAKAKNCIFWNVGQEISHIDGSSIDISYSNIRDGYPGKGNINIEPLFAAPGRWIHMNDPNMPVEPNDPNAVWGDGDYHLKSQAGRYDPINEIWLQDDVTSPCIDAGDPDSDWKPELWPHGIRVNMGAYGGTLHASRSLSDAGNIADLNRDGIVDCADMCIIVDHWGENYPLCDIGPTPLGDGIVDVQDLIVLAEHLFEGIPPVELEDVHVDENDDGSQVELEQGQILVVTLESNPTTGYGWEVSEIQESILEQMGEAEFKPSQTGEPPMPGAGGWEIFRFKAIGAGQMTLQLIYHAPWEEGVEPINTFSIEVVVR